MITLNPNLFISFIAGFVTFFASCFAPLVPIYLAYLSGVSLNQKTAKKHRWLLFITSLYFVLGFALTFMALGTTFHFLSHFLHHYHYLFNKLGGLFLMVMGLLATGLFSLPLLSREFHFKLYGWFNRNHFFHSFFTGVTFALAWSPCIGPVLGTILLWTASTQTLLRGLFLLFVYSLGLGLPFILFALAFDFVSPLFRSLRPLGRYLQIITGGFIFLFGLLLFFR